MSERQHKELKWGTGEPNTLLDVFGIGVYACVDVSWRADTTRTPRDCCQQLVKMNSYWCPINDRLDTLDELEELVKAG